MIEHPHIDQTQRLFEAFGQQTVGLARFRDARRVVVGEDHGGRIVSQRSLDDLPGVDRSLGQRAMEQVVGRDQTVLGIEGEIFAHALDTKLAQGGVKSEVDLRADDLKHLVEVFKDLVSQHAGIAFPQDPREQLDMAVRAVFESWNTERARLYRRRERIPHDLGTAVNICTMVFGNMGQTSGTGVCFTRDPSTGENIFYGEYLVNAQGEDVVAGIRNTEDLDTLGKHFPEIHDELLEIFDRLEAHYEDMCDTEFTIERGKLWMLQTRVGKRTGAAALRMAVEMATGKQGRPGAKWKISKREAIMRVTADHLDSVLHPQLDGKGTVLAKGLAASPGAAVGRVYFTADEQRILRNFRRNITPGIRTVKFSGLPYDPIADADVSILSGPFDPMEQNAPLSRPIRQRPGRPR